MRSPNVGGVTGSNWPELRSTGTRAVTGVRLHFVRKLDKDSAAVARKLATRTMSDPAKDPATGADLGAGPGAGLVTGSDKGGAKDIKEAAAMADAI